MALNINGTTGISGVDGSASAPAVTGTDSNTGINFASDTVNINTGGSTRATVDSSGRLLLGTTTAGAAQCDTFTLETSGHTGMTFFSGSSSRGTIAFGDGRTGNEQYRGAFIYDHSDDSLRSVTADAEQMRIDSSGRVLINRTSAFSTGTSGTESAKLQVGISGTSGTAVGLADTGGYDTNVMVMNHARAGANSGAFTGVMIQFRNGSNTSVGGISSGASTTTYSTSSDYRLKENEVLISDGITRLKQLKPYRFNFKVTPNITQDGFFAHEAQTVVPQAVTGTKDGMRPETYYEEGEDLPSGKVVGDVKTYSSTEIDIQQLDYSQLVPLLTAALQEAVAKIEVLETKVAALEAG